MARKITAKCALMLFVAAGFSTISAASEPGTDASIRPGDDFFGFANGEWLNAMEIPASHERWNARTEIDVRTAAQLDAVFADAATAPVGSDARKIEDFRAAYANEALIEARGLVPLKPLLRRIARIHDVATLTAVLGSQVPVDVDPLNWGVYDSAHLLGLSVAEGNHGEQTYVAYLLQGGLGLPSRDAYLNAAAGDLALRAQYQHYIGGLLALAGFDRTPMRAEAVLRLETAIARSHATAEASANDHNSDNLWTRADFAREAPGLDWAAFFAAAGLSKQQSFVVWQPGAVQGVAALVASQPIDAWQDYLRFHLLDAHADLLPRAYADLAFAFHGVAVSGAKSQSPRAQRATEATRKALAEIIGRRYVEQFFPAEFKARLQVISANVASAFAERVQAVSWLSPASKRLALAKLATLYVGLGYPEKWRDFSFLAIDPQDAIGNLRRVNDWNHRAALARLGQPVDATEWRMAPQTVGAVLVFQQNAYDFTAALLQPPKFDPAASDASNYGAIGAVLAHDISHFVDTLGAEYGIDGGARRWWTAEDLANYQQATLPLVQQYAGYRPFPDAAVDGRLTLVENVADLGGLNAAFDAYRQTLGSRATDREFVRRQDREFFIGYARAWRGKVREAALRRQLTTDSHAPERDRVATVRNLDAWYDAFDVQPGQLLYLPPAARVRVW